MRCVALPPWKGREQREREGRRRAKEERVLTIILLLGVGARPRELRPGRWREGEEAEREMVCGERSEGRENGLRASRVAWTVEGGGGGLG